MAASAATIVNALVPVALFLGAGVALRRRLRWDARPATRLALYVFSPALVFSSLIHPGLAAHDLLGIAAFALLMLAAAVGLARAAGRLLGLSRPDQGALDLAAAFSNSANLGLPVVAFALGGRSLHAAVVFVLTQVVAVNTVGAYLAGRAGVDTRAALRRMVRLPSLWALALAATVGALHLGLPAGLVNAARLGGQAYAPTVLAVLGSTLAAWPRGALRQRALWLAAGLRLVVMPALAVGAASLLHLSLPAARAVVLQVAMPVAVNALILAQEFDARPEQVARAIALTTLLAAATVPAWLTAVAAGLR